MENLNCPMEQAHFIVDHNVTSPTLKLEVRISRDTAEDSSPKQSKYNQNLYDCPIHTIQRRTKPHHLVRTAEIDYQDFQFPVTL